MVKLEELHLTFYTVVQTRARTMALTC